MGYIVSSGPSYATHTKILTQKPSKQLSIHNTQECSTCVVYTRPGFYPQHYQKYIQITASTGQTSVYLGVYETLIAYLMKLL